MRTDQNGAVLAGQHAVALGAAAGAPAELALAVTPIERAVHLGALNPDAAQFVPVSNRVMRGLRGINLLLPLCGGCLRCQTLRLCGACSLAGSAGSLLLGCFCGSLTGCCLTGRSGSCLGLPLPIFGEDQRRTDADADRQRQRAEGKTSRQPGVHVRFSRAAR